MHTLCRNVGIKLDVMQEDVSHTIPCRTRILSRRPFSLKKGVHIVVIGSEDIAVLVYVAKCIRSRCMVVFI